MRKKHPHSEIDREMNRALKHAKSPAEIMAIKAEAREKRQQTVKGQDVVVDMPTLPDFSQFQAMAEGISRAFRQATISWTVECDVKPPSVDRAKLDALKVAEPYRVMKRAPDMISVITAWRAWVPVYGKSGWRLRALGKDHIWEPKQQMEAACARDMNPFTHPAPNFDCNCGVWAFKELDGLVSALEKYSDIRVLGKVSLWGRVIETENGYRAQHAYPSELWLLDSSLEELGLIYDVPVRMAE